MAESFLQDQLRRIREMSERMSRARSDAAELSAEIARNREAARHGPLHDIRDLRTYSSTIGSGSADESSDRSESHAGTPRRHTARESSRRRRR